MRGAMEDEPTPPQPGPSLAPDLELTTAFDPMDGLIGLEDHLAALKAQALAAGIAFDRHGLRNELQAATFRLREACTVRLLVSPSGAVAIEIRPPS